jgi:small subunit ribosomal protein S7e
MSKKENQKKEVKSEIEKNIINALEKIKDSEKEHKAELEPLKIEHANEIKMSDDKKCYLIQISTQNLPGFKKVHSLLTQKLEEHLSNAVMIIPARKRVNGKEYRTYVSKKVPRDRTLSAVFDSYLDDILYPATIIGKRIRYPVGKTTRTYKVIVDSLDKESISDRLDAMKACYKALTNRKLDIEF